MTDTNYILNFIPENFHEIAKITGISVNDLMLPVATLRDTDTRSFRYGYTWSYRDGKRVYDTYGKQVIYRGEERAIIGFEKAGIGRIGNLIQFDREELFKHLKRSGIKGIGHLRFNQIWELLSNRFNIESPIKLKLPSGKIDTSSRLVTLPHLHQLEEFLNPTFIDPHYIYRFADFGFKLQADRVAQPIISEFGAGADTVQKWHIPRHFAYSSDNGIKGGGPDLACAEIEERLADIQAFLKILSCETLPTCKYYDIPSQDAAGASIHAYQLGANRLRGYGVVNGVNCAPRIDERGKQSDNGGEAVYSGMLPNGAIVFGTGPHCFGLYREAIENGEVEFFKTGVAIKGSQFRSRDFWTFVGTLIAINIPDEGARLFADRHNPPSLEQRRELLKTMRFIETDKRLKPNAIPLLQENGQPRILFEDIHGNLKLAIKWQQLGNGGLKEGDKVALTVKGKSVDAIVTMAPFSLPEGTIALSAGSARSPYELARPDNALVEIFQVGRRVADHFGITAEDLRRGTYVDIVDCLRGRFLDFGVRRHIELAQA